MMQIRVLLEITNRNNLVLDEHSTDLDETALSLRDVSSGSTMFTKFLPSLQGRVNSRLVT